MGRSSLNPSNFLWPTQPRLPLLSERRFNLLHQIPCPTLHKPLIIQPLQKCRVVRQDHHSLRLALAQQLQVCLRNSYRPHENHWDKILLALGQDGYLRVGIEQLVDRKSICICCLAILYDTFARAKTEQVRHPV
ncbi:hypothetical protein I7I53_02318 [Histoplasma capsulatum var. duboisii H88]|uniref:Uncharacterized protein n=1 Tax=Ajellomyces capsulatus (strain H88) TaxID=544711 RepID=A0A8A1LRP6_AJEC8|nr:hypothetical protein I7I53_02318 [Histoplasma capsulatum var. duboisii H88]